MTTIDKSVYLGGQDDPQPTWRDEATDAAQWPEGAVFRITFDGMSIPPVLRTELTTFTEYYDAHGWPLELPEQRRALPEAMKREFQTYLWGWRKWQDGAWQNAAEAPYTFIDMRRQWTLARTLLEATPAT